MAASIRREAGSWHIDRFDVVNANVWSIESAVDDAMYSVIIPAFNEEYWLSKSVPAARAAMNAVGMSGELIVVDNNSTDATTAVAKTLGA